MNIKDIDIKKYLEFEGIKIVLINTHVIEPNNVLAFDDNGKLLWKINSILEIKNPTGMVEILKKNNKVLSVISDLSIQYDIDIENFKILDKIYLR